MPLIMCFLLLHLYSVQLEKQRLGVVLPSIIPVRLPIIAHPQHLDLQQLQAGSESVPIRGDHYLSSARPLSVRKPGVPSSEIYGIPVLSPS